MNHVALTVDLEDWYHGVGLPPPTLSKLEMDTDWILEVFAQANVQATFFVLGEVAERFPNLIKKIVQMGHEVGFHGYQHEFLNKLGPKQFTCHLERWLPWLEDLIGQPVYGFRAPFFSVTPDSEWALKILAQTPLLYDASIYSGYHDRHRWPQGPTTPVRLVDSHLIIFPVPILHPRLPVAFSGGAYLRILPWPIIRWGFQQQDTKQEPGMIYFHPWEVSTSLPRSPQISLRNRLTRYTGLKKMRTRLQTLLTSENFTLTPMKEVIASLTKIPIWDPF